MITSSRGEFISMEGLGNLASKEVGKKWGREPGGRDHDKWKELRFGPKGKDFSSPTKCVIRCPGGKMSRREEEHLSHLQFAVYPADTKREHWNLERGIVPYVLPMLWA